MMSTASETRLRIASPQNAPQVEPMHVVLEPIVVVGRRSASPLEARADPPSRGKQPG
jgi:hypothetical protein